MAKFTFVKKRLATPPPAPKPDPVHPLNGKLVTFTQDGVQMVGLAVMDPDSKFVTVRLAVPDDDGKFTVGTGTVSKTPAQVTPCDGEWQERRVQGFQTQTILEEGSKGLAVKNAEGQIVDYTDVQFTGYASTFSAVTESDRQGDRVNPGAFRATIAEFKKNPVMLLDHYNSVNNIGGHYEEIREDDRGLFVRGVISNAPELKTIRFHLMERSLRTLSIGGLFLYAADGRTIETVHLFEISLVAIPANPDCLITARALDMETARKMFLRRKALAA